MKKARFYYDYFMSLDEKYENMPLIGFDYQLRGDVRDMLREKEGNTE